MKPLRDHLARKRCVLVGPAAYLQGQALGWWIDSHDVVVRMNWGLASARQWPEDYGKRTDVLFMRRRLLEGAATDGYFQRWAGWLVSIGSSFRIPRALKPALTRGTQVTSVGSLGALRREIGEPPLAAAIAASNLLEWGVRELCITGCDFYDTPYHEGYPGEERRHHLARQDGIMGVAHSPDRQAAYFRRLGKDPRMTFDERLASILDGRTEPCETR